MKQSCSTYPSGNDATGGTYSGNKPRNGSSSGNDPRNGSSSGLAIDSFRLSPPITTERGSGPVSMLFYGPIREIGRSGSWPTDQIFNAYRTRSTFQVLRHRIRNYNPGFPKCSHPVCDRASVWFRYPCVSGLPSLFLLTRSLRGDGKKCESGETPFRLIIQGTDSSRPGIRRTKS